MPNKRDPDKKLIGYQARAEVVNAIDDFARENNLASRSEALELLLLEALKARSVKVPGRVYYPDRRVVKKTARRKKS